jgi:hypothetical protein
MAKIIKCTHIDTGGHGYYSVSKRDIALLGIQKQITGYSGHSLTRVYLEEDCDGTLLYDTCKKRGYEIRVKQSYNERFKITHNYNPDLFDYQPKVGQVIGVGERKYKVREIFLSKHKMIVELIDGKWGIRCKIRLTNPFELITELVSE